MTEKRTEYTEDEFIIVKYYVLDSLSEEERETYDDDEIDDVCKIICQDDLERPEDMDPTIELNLDDLELVTGAGKLEDLLSLIKQRGIYREMKYLLNNGRKVEAVQKCVALGGPLVYLCNDVIGLIK